MPSDTVIVEGIVSYYFVDDYHTSEVGVCSEVIGYSSRSGETSWEISHYGREILRDALDALNGHAVRVTVEPLPEPWGERRFDMAGNLVWTAAQPEIENLGGNDV